MRALDRERPLFSSFSSIMRFAGVEVETRQDLGTLLLDGSQLSGIEAQRLQRSLVQVTRRSDGYL